MLGSGSMARGAVCVSGGGFMPFGSVGQLPRGSVGAQAAHEGLAWWPQGTCILVQVDRWSQATSWTGPQGIGMPALAAYGV